MSPSHLLLTAIVFSQTPSLEPPRDVAHRASAAEASADWPDPVRSDVTKLPLDTLLELLPPRDRQQRTPADGRVERHPVAREFAARLLGGDEPCPAQWASLLLRTRALQFRHRWPLTGPFFAGSLFLGLDVPPEYGRVTVRACTPEARTVRRGVKRGADPIGGCALEHRLWPRDVDPILELRGELALAGSHTIEFELTVESVGTKFSVEFEIVQQLDDAMPSANGPAIDAAVRDAIGLEIRGSGAWRRPAFTLARSSVERAELPSLAICADLEWRRDGLCLSACHLDAREGTCELRHIDGSEYLPGECSDFSFDAVRFGSSTQLPESAPTLRVTSRAWHVLTQWSCDRYWLGSFEVTLEQLLRQAARR